MPCAAKARVEPPDGREAGPMMLDGELPHGRRHFERGLASPILSPDAEPLPREGRKVSASMSVLAKRELLARVAPRYLSATSQQKSVILDECVAVTGYAREYAIRLLAQPVPVPTPLTRPRERFYGAAVRDALVVAWTAANRICAKRLVPFPPELVSTLERHGQSGADRCGARPTPQRRSGDRRSHPAPLSRTRCVARHDDHAAWATHQATYRPEGTRGAHLHRLG